jgi:hypothetical protein
MRRVLKIVTPDEAKEILKGYNFKNILIKKKLEKYKSMMIAGTWKPNKSTFIRIRKGKLMDGHHRMTAIVESGVSVLMAIQYEQ